MNGIDAYIAQFEPEVQARLIALRQLFLQAYPAYEESMRYKMPAFKVGNYYLYFAAYNKHIGFYPVTGLAELEGQLSRYRAKGTKDSLHFVHSEPLPIDLIKEIIRLKSMQK